MGGSPGTLYGVGVGPGDPRLLTVAAVEAIRDAAVIAYHAKASGSSVARGIVAAHLREDHVEEELLYPVTTGPTDHPGGYRGAVDEFYGEASGRLAAHLDAGRDVALLAEGDPFLYSSFQHLHERLADRYPTVVIPGISAVTAASAALGRPLVEGEEALTVLPGTLPADELAARLAGADSAVVVKLGRTFTTVREAFDRAGRLGEAWYAERVTSARERAAPLADIDPAQVPYFSLAVVASRRGKPSWWKGPAAGRGPRRAHPPPADTSSPAPAPGYVAASSTSSPGPLAGPGPASAPGYVEVIGLGPAGAMWRSPEATGALARATDVVGYTTYVARVPDRPGLRKHDSDNKVESERAEFALDLALRGCRVVVVSSGDPGVFAMATAVFEVAGQERYAAVPVRVVPGMTAAHAAAARVGAPLGHDHAMISLSDRLKPFDVVRDRVRAAAAADLVLALYNPASRDRTWQVGVLRDDLLAVRDPATPVVVARAVGAPDESVAVVALADLDPLVVDMRTLLIVGSSRTRVDQRCSPDGSASAGARAGPGLQDVVWTPRRYPGASAAPHPGGVGHGRGHV